MAPPGPLVLCGVLLCAHALQASILSGQSGRLAVEDTANEEYAVPKDLLIGAGISALQTEGAWNEEGRGESAADHLLHEGKLFPGGPQHAHDQAADSYHRYKDDIAMAVALKLKLFRFSFSWTRLLPTADVSKPNQQGVDHYHQLIDEIIKNGMTPMATLYHFDHPQILEASFGGWVGEQMVDKFEEYARFVFQEYGKKVKHWVTINEPNVYCTYFVLAFSGDLTHQTTKERFKCIRNNILGHAKAYHAFKDLKLEGVVGFSAHTIHATPASTLPEDVYAADAFNQFQSGSTLQPVVTGDYPQIVKDLGAEAVVPFTEDEQALIRNTADFMGLNVYYSMTATYNASQSDDSANVPIFAPGKLGLEFIPFVQTKSNIKGDMTQLYSEVTPDALESVMLWTWQSYKVPIFITENGFADVENLGLRDGRRAVYHSAYLRTLIKTMKAFDVPVLGYCAWSLVDAYEWSANFGRRFGLVHVDYEGGTLERSLKDSKDFWITMADTGVVPLVSSASGQCVSTLAVLVAAAASLYTQRL
ncbi:myrosinase 1-like [Thrips palmi]|uniref:beta-glucosidase n=1 Tax=Thrips palmi TaxID=161013 RepID=A0A6P8ZBM3_THRPL|nr:myrosinase 1-like [Thrips palmi]XP_034245358.1 myrosinase 1-like [Thrips palmi]